MSQKIDEKQKNQNFTNQISSKDQIKRKERMKSIIIIKLLQR